MRTDQDKVTQAPLKLVFGEKTYEVKPLNILKNQAWRTKLNEVMGPITDQFQSADANLGSTLRSALLEFPEKVAELVFAFAPSLPKDEILEQATDEQMSNAFTEVLGVAYPYFAPLGTMTRILRPTVSR